MHAPSRKIVVPPRGAYFPFGRSTSRNILEDYSPQTYPEEVVAALPLAPSTSETPALTPSTSMRHNPSTTPSQGPTDERSELVESPIPRQADPSSKSAKKSARKNKGKSPKSQQSPATCSLQKINEDTELLPSTSSLKSPKESSSSKSTESQATQLLNEPLPGRSTINILLMRCTDLHDTLLSIASTPKGDEAPLLNFYLGHDCPLNLARNVLLLKIMLSSKFHCRDPDSMQYLWDVWFNFSWSKFTAKRFSKDLHELIQGSLPFNTRFPPSYAQTLYSIWVGWKSLVDGFFTSAETRKLTHRQRRMEICLGWNLKFDPRVPRNDTTMGRETKEVMHRMDIVMSTDNFLSEGRSQKSYQCSHSWIRDGHSNTREYKFIEENLNPTLMGQGGLEWIIHPRVNPLTGFLPINVDEIQIPEGQAGEDKLHSTFRDQLMNLVSSLQERQKNIHFNFLLNDDPLQLCFDPESTDLYHVIDSADLADRVGLANLLLAAERKLVKHPSSMLLTNVSCWKSSAGNLLQYVEGSLCAPVSMLPTLYGLRLVTPVQLGSSSPTDFNSYKLNQLLNCTLSWRWTPAFDNVKLDQHSPFLQDRLLDRLLEKCFKPQIGSDVSFYTPQTFHYLMIALARRTKDPDWIRNFYSTRISRHFSLAWKTQQDWSNRNPVILHDVNLDTLLDQDWLMEERSVRLILSPSEDYSPEALMLDNCHYFDNLELVTILDVDGSRLKKVSFLLTKDNGLKEEILYGYLVEVIEGRLIVSLGQLIPKINNIVEDPYASPHPYPADHPPTHSSKWVSRCLETREGYQLDIPFSYHLSSTDVKPPCESANQLILTAEESETVTVVLPQPFVHDSWKAKSQPIEGSRIIFLKKSLLEPLPEAFTSTHRWNPDHLGNSSLVDEPRFVKRVDNGNLSIHLERQFSSESLEPKTNPLNGLRRLFSVIFHRLWPLIDHQDVFFDIRYVDPSESSKIAKEKKPDWILMAHSPAKIAPDGTPMLIVTAFDCQMEGVASLEGSGKGVSTIFKGVEDRSMKFCTRSPAENALLRSSLRHNSTKIGPNQWQKVNLPTGVVPSPWLCTFLAPLYADKPRRVRQIVLETKVCQNCNNSIPPASADERLWECGLCLNVRYCSQKCRDDHFNQHRPLCRHL